ncbi:polysaccharide pyruvyl transferase CsaB [Heliobacterium undosum]|uniref:Polysaccharide pyruvyl transferase CsaB n=1 Tax=Heliomicrobium undosum TaxID=121734 RepID=A0A845L3V9_9FIRM|nr:polysaccharide pyruvyl transferase CsaB [Heliomicrobium undosum]MZP29534.1 polysaccharide pyruvyl transferase CsaB [Heliomicrobium undosum]
MATIVLSGYYGYENAGDEALLKAMIIVMRKLQPNVRIIVLSGNPSLTRKDHGVHAVHRYNPFAVFSVVWKADLFISGGGSLLQDVTGRLTIPYYLLVVALALFLRKKVMFYAQGIGPVQRNFGKWLIRLISNRVDLITLRDAASARRLKAMGVTDPQICVTGDPVFALVPEQSGHRPQPLVPEAVFCLRPWRKMKGMEEACLALARHLIDRGWRVTFLPLHAGEDREFAITMAEQLGRSEAQVVSRGLHFENALEIVSEASLLVGVRLHALMFATLLGVPVIGISYDPKVTGFLEDTGRPVFGVTHPLSGNTLIEEVDRIIKNYDDECHKASFWAARLKERAEETARMAMELLETRQ